MDTGDMFQGSMLAVKTTGKAFVPLLNALNYDLYLPGNWEVVYNKQNMQHLMGGLLTPKVCANMYHDAGDGKRGSLIFQPYQIFNRLGLKSVFWDIPTRWFRFVNLPCTVKELFTPNPKKA